MAELEMQVKVTSPDIIGITESWAKCDFDDPELNLLGYVMFRKDRENQSSKGHVKGGVLLFIKEGLHAIEQIDIENDQFKEHIWCEIRSHRKKILVGVCYRTPSALEEADNGMFAFINRVARENVVMTGDFNYHIDWEHWIQKDHEIGNF